MSGFYTVMVEWNGVKPPTSWYQKIRKMGLNVRHNTQYIGHETPPISNRLHNEKMGVVFQEGVYVLSNESAAKTLAALAYQKGARSVLVGEFNPLPDSRMGDDEKHALARISEKATNRNGITSWVITCYDELKTFVVEDNSKPSYCPSCSSFRVNVDVGTCPSYKMPALKESVDGTEYIYIYKAWLYSHYRNGKMIFPKWDGAEEPQEPMQSFIPSTAHLPATESVIKLFSDNKITAEEAMTLFSALEGATMFDAEKRARNRVLAIADYIKSGLKIEGDVLTPPEQVDLFDAIHFAKSTAIKAMKKLQEVS